MTKYELHYLEALKDIGEMIVFYDREKTVLDLIENHFKINDPRYSKDYNRGVREVYNTIKNKKY